MDVRIYRPSKTAMQSGRARTRAWVLEFEPAAREEIDNLMGWTGSGDTRRQIRLRFESKADAVAYAERHGLSYRVIPAHERRVRRRSYADNFPFERAV